MERAGLDEQFQKYLPKPMLLKDSEARPHVSKAGDVWSYKSGALINGEKEASHLHLRFFEPDKNLPLAKFENICFHQKRCGVGCFPRVMSLDMGTKPPLPMIGGNSLPKNGGNTTIASMNAKNTKGNDTMPEYVRNDWDWYRDDVDGERRNLGEPDK